MLSAQHMPAQTTMLHARPPQQPCPQHTQLVPTHTPSYQAPAALQINLLSLGHQANTADMPPCDTNHALRSAYHPFLCTSCSTHTHVQHDRGSHYCCQGKQTASLFSCAACTATASCLHTHRVIRYITSSTFSAAWQVRLNKQSLPSETPNRSLNPQPKPTRRPLYKQCYSPLSPRDSQTSLQLPGRQPMFTYYTAICSITA